MSRPSILILLGVLLMLIPFSGLPVSFRVLVVVVLGAAVFAIGLSLRPRGE